MAKQAVAKELISIPLSAGMAEETRGLARRLGLSLTGLIQASLLSFLPRASASKNENSGLLARGRRRAVDYYSSCLLMPRDLIRKAVAGLALTDWPTLYSLAESFKVTISALCVRLEKLGLICIKGREIYPSREEAFGQAALDLGRA